MVLVTSGKDWKGEPCEFYLDGYMKSNLDRVKEVVQKKDWDYVAIVAGNPGTGKSNFSQSLAKYCCPWFDETYIAFDTDDFVRITNNCPKNSSIILDESFQGLNSRVTMTSGFNKIVNHLQIIRQKNLFIFLCLPNYFDLAKGIAIFRSTHLFVCYSPKYGDRGTFMAFDGERKKSLYVLGGKFMNYKAVKANFIGRFTRQKGIDENKYIELKNKHLMAQEKAGSGVKLRGVVKTLVKHLNVVEGWDVQRIARIATLTVPTIYNYLNEGKAEDRTKPGAPLANGGED